MQLREGNFHYFFATVRFFICVYFIMKSTAAFGDAFNALRHRMVETQIRSRGVHDANVLRAMNTVPRHLFVAKELAEVSYDDCPQSIGYGQTISQPYIVAYMAEAAKLTSNDNVLEVGTGCGYAAAIFGQIAREVHTIELIKELAHEAKNRLHELGFNNVHCYASDGSIGLAEHAPYDAIIVAASAPNVPHSLKQQLAVNGRLIIPVKVNAFGESLMRITRKEGDRFEEEHLMDVRFVPLIGKEGFHRG
jgi:protein-L-isoaspartate(D-aspartate) O-methyltransferase